MSAWSKTTSLLPELIWKSFFLNMNKNMEEKKEQTKTISQGVAVSIELFLSLKWPLRNNFLATLFSQGHRETIITTKAAEFR